MGLLLTSGVGRRRSAPASSKSFVDCCLAIACEEFRVETARAVGAASTSARPKDLIEERAAMSLTPSLKSTTASLEPREWTDRRASAQALRAAQARHASGRRRFVDPATCERDYSIAEMEFMQAMQEYKYASGRNFPTWSEVLEVLRSLGYEKPDNLGGLLSSRMSSPAD